MTPRNSFTKRLLKMMKEYVETDPRYQRKRMVCLIPVAPRHPTPPDAS